jgi:hypothetical protein
MELQLSDGLLTADSQWTDSHASFFKDDLTSLFQSVCHVFKVGRQEGCLCFRTPRIALAEENVCAVGLCNLSSVVIGLESIQMFKF